MSEEGQQRSVLRDRIEELLFRLRRDDERMNAQLSSGLAGIFTSNAMQREDVTKALEDMLRIDSEPPAGKVKIEHAILMSGGSMQVRNDDPEMERIYPLVLWISAHQGMTEKVYRRTIAVVSDWEEVKRP